MPEFITEGKNRAKVQADQPQVAREPMRQALPSGVQMSGLLTHAGPAVRLSTSVMPQRGDASHETVHQAAEQGVRTPATALPFAEKIQRSFGRHDVTGIEAHVGETATSSALAMNAGAFATGNHVVFAGTPDLRTAAHEATHVIQQRGGIQLAGGVGQVGDAYEHHADAVASRVIAGETAEDLLAPFAGLPNRANGGRRNSGLQRLIQRVNLDDINPNLGTYFRQRILDFIQNQNNNSTSFREVLAPQPLLGTPWTCELRVDLAGAAHGPYETPHIQFTQVQRNGQNQNVDDIREATRAETYSIINNRRLPQSINTWAWNILQQREHAIQNPPPPGPDMDQILDEGGLDLFNQDNV